MCGLRWAAQAANLALDFLFPRRCVTCGRYGDYVCDPCRDGMTAADGDRCRRCWRPVTGGPWCETCAGGGFELAAVRAPYVFDGTARDLVHALKYHGVTAVAPILGRAMAEAAALLPERPDLVVPVPLHGRRERERGYNQAGLLARHAGERLGIPVANRALVRHRSTRPQARMPGAEERLRNVQDAFSARKPYVFVGAVVVVVDDVTTTGATLEACARVLRAHGAERVHGLTFAVDD